MIHLLNLLAAVALLVWGRQIVRTGALAKTRLRQSEQAGLSADELRA